MGNAQAKEARASRFGSSASHLEAAGSSSATGRNGDRSERSARRTSSRPDLAALGLTTSRQERSGGEQRDDAPFERRETKAEREARRLERERASRLKERERSMQEEHVDGGYLVTTGIYTASEDFSKSTVRHLQIERRIAPFWRGLDDFSESWVEHQIIAAARGIDIPPADEIPDHLRPQPTDSPSASMSNLNNLTVPMGPRTMSASSDRSVSQPGSGLPSPTQPTSAGRVASSFKPKKALGAVLSLTRNSSSTELGPREAHLPHDPFVNGQPIEVYLYKQGTECPLCLMYYPPYLNRTRCCDQLICSECFVQIKRPDPHYPEHHGDNEGSSNNAAGSSASPDDDENRQSELVMEPAKCPYCTQSEFGITYDPPPFRRGVVHEVGGRGVGSLSNAMSSSSSLTSGTPPTSNPINRKRGQSLSAIAPNVITTDRIRPEWTTKLAAARAQQRRRAAAADALHHAAFFQPEAPRTIFGRSSRFSRRNTRDMRGTPSPIEAQSPAQPQTDSGVDTPAGPEPGPRGSSGRTGRERFDAAHLESLMMAEAIRLSLADEEDRRKKAEKDAKKEAKKKEKEDRKAAKRHTVYGAPSSGGGGASSSSLSLPFGRKRGNSAASNLRYDASPTTSKPPTSEPREIVDTGKGKGVDRSGAESAGSTSSLTATAPINVPTLPSPRGGSHLRQMSNASSIETSDVDSAQGSYVNKHLALEDPHASGLSLSGQSGDEGANTNPAESLFNFQSLAEMVGVHIDGEPEEVESGKISPKGKEDSKEADAEVAHEEHVEHVPAAPPKPTLKTDVESSNTGQTTEKAQPIEADVKQLPALATMPTPTLTLTPETPTVADGHNTDKQLGTVVGSTEHADDVTH